MRDTFVKTITELAKRDKNIELITGDLGFGVLKPFWEACPNQFTNAGIAEQNMTSIAAGMSLCGKVVFTYSIGNFPTLRCLEQIRNDCAYHNANVKIVCVGGGFSYGSLGMSHHATEDISILRTIPGVSVFAPADLIEATAVIKAVVDYPGTSYIRLGRGGEKIIHTKSLEKYEIGKAIKVSEGKRIAFLSTGAIFEEVNKAANILRDCGISPALYTFPTVKPLDVKTIKEVVSNFELVVTIEENVLNGGFGSSVLEVVFDSNMQKAQIIRIGLKDSFVTSVGDQNYLREKCGLDAKTIARKVVEYFEKI